MKIFNETITVVCVKDHQMETAQKTQNWKQKQNFKPFYNPFYLMVSCPKDCLDSNLQEGHPTVKGAPKENNKNVQ